jgi:hypothetical protein
MIAILISIVGILYLIISFLYMQNANLPMGLVFICYSIANMAIYFAGNH